MNLEFTRRRFVQLAAAAASAAGKSALAAKRFQGYVEIKVDPADELTKTASVAWAISQLRSALKEKEIPTQGRGKAAATIVVAPLKSAFATGFTLPEERKAEMVVLLPGHDREDQILVSGVDARGLIYGLLELTDRVRAFEDLASALALHAPIVETSPNRVRSVSRAFCSEIEDKSWFYDRDF